jgi:hypothetical protein
MNHKREGYYVVMEYTAEPPVASEIDRVLHLADEVLRHKTIRLPDKIKRNAVPAPAPAPVSKAPAAPAPVPASPVEEAPAPVAAEVATSEAEGPTADASETD